MIAKKEQDHLDALYADRKPFYGELHDHAATGGTSDGKVELSLWREDMKALNIDFAAILDHKQVRHMYLPEWEDGIFIGGSEPGTAISDSKAEIGKMHYNMLFENAAPLEKLLEKFSEYEFEGGKEGHFIYPKFTTERFCELIDTVKEMGGFFVHPHPKQIMVSPDALDYWFRDETGLEVFYGAADSEDTENNYALWTALLALGKRVWATAGGDGHASVSDKALTTIYAEQKSNKVYLSHLRAGDMTCGAVGIQMCIGDTKMGGVCAFDGKRLVLRVGDFHKSVCFADHTYRVDIINDKGMVQSVDMTAKVPLYFALDTTACKFYRVEVFDTTLDKRIALGNPIWNQNA